MMKFFKYTVLTCSVLASCGIFETNASSGPFHMPKEMKALRSGIEGLANAQPDLTQMTFPVPYRYEFREEKSHYQKSSGTAGICSDAIKLASDTDHTTQVFLIQAVYQFVGTIGEVFNSLDKKDPDCAKERPHKYQQRINDIAMTLSRLGFLQAGTWTFKAQADGTLTWNVNSSDGSDIMNFISKNGINSPIKKGLGAIYNPSYSGTTNFQKGSVDRIQLATEIQTLRDQCVALLGNDQANVSISGVNDTVANFLDKGWWKDGSTRHAGFNDIATMIRAIPDTDPATYHTTVMHNVSLFNLLSRAQTNILNSVMVPSPEPAS